MRTLTKNLQIVLTRTDKKYEASLSITIKFYYNTRILRPDKSRKRFKNF